MKNSQGDCELSRRDFIKTTGVTTAALAAASLVDGGDSARASVPRSGRIIGANDRINYAIVGVGGMGGGHLRILKDFEATENISVVAVCDVFEKRRRKAQEVAKISDAMVFNDYRRLLENKDIDVVVIATPDHWHARIAINAMESGKHIYVEKPMTHTLDEAFDLYKTAKRTGRSVQVGSHGCSDPKWHRAKEVISANRLRRLLW
jgi:predicted dehydrogenase